MFRASALSGHGERDKGQWEVGGWGLCPQGWLGLVSSPDQPKARKKLPDLANKKHRMAVKFEFQINMTNSL